MTLVLFSFYHRLLCTLIPTRIFGLTFTCHHVCRCGLKKTILKRELCLHPPFYVTGESRESVTLALRRKGIFVYN